jgi:rhodanese-related sulfurtransferase
MRSLLAAVAVFALAVPAVAQHTADPPAAVKKAVADKTAVLVDVREKTEWDDGHIKDAVFLPLSALKDGLPADAREKLPKDKPVYLHCASGRRCLKAADALKKLGYDARPLKQGYQDLIDAGFPKADR